MTTSWPSMRCTVSPPSRGRGLKWRNVYPLECPHWSPPSRGRGLKYTVNVEDERDIRSPPSRGRGLKSVDQGLPVEGPSSPPSRGRGLKFDTVLFDAWHHVAPFTGAWIEIIMCLHTH